jgi:histidinol phosphatase-like PHP family hydrolase
MKNWERYRTYLGTGDFHVHTSYTEGLNSVFELCEQAIQNGLRLVCFAEHVRREISYSYDDLLRDIQEARRLYPGLKILSGCEAKVLNWSGSLDVSPEILKKAEIVIASFHSFPQGPKEDYVRALFGALRHPRVDIWGHPQTFLRNVNLTPPELQAIIRECKKRRVLIEDSLVETYRTPPGFLDMCKKLGATLVTDSDAHCKEDLKRI